MNVLSNSNYKRGYIISLKGDTIQGYLLPQNSINASKKCNFRETPDADEKVYSPSEISAYRFIDGKYFVVRQITDAENQTTQNVFMEFFIKGVVSIYYYVDYLGEHYYIEKEPYGLRELSDPIRTNSSGQITPSLYKGKLRSLMADCPEVQSGISDAKLNYSSLV
jgi:hypothetical protein